MSSIINNETTQLINTVNHDIRSEKRSVKRGQAQIAAANRAQGKATKDIVLPSASDGQDAVVSKGKMAETKPQLPPTTTKFMGFRGSTNNSEEGNQTLGLIAIIGECMSLQAKSNSNFWSTMWKQASESMMIEVKYAPVIGDAIKSAYTAQSLATSAQSSQSKEDGLISLVMFGGAMVTAGIMEFGQNPNGELGPDQEETRLENETTQNVGPENLNNDLLENEDEIQERPNANQEENAAAANNVANSEDSPWGKKLKKIGKFLSDMASGGQRRMISILGKGMQSAMAFEMASKGITGYFVDSKYQATQSREQALEGQAQAVSKEAEQYSQFYGQSFSRSDQLTSAGQQNIDYAMNILKSAADTITGTVTSMFRG